MQRYFHFFLFSKIFSIKQYNKVNKYRDPSSFILNFAVPIVLLKYFIGITLYLNPLEIVLRGSSKKILKSSETIGKK